MFNLFTYRFIKFLVLVFCSVFYTSTGFTTPSLASNSKWRGAISLGAGFSGLKDDHPTHIMIHQSLGIFGGYQFSNWVIGPTLDLRYMQQLSSLASVGGTNFAGRGLTWGFGARYDYTPELLIKTALLFGGDYLFARQTYAGEDARLALPIAIQVKPQFFFSPGKPYSIDFDFRLAQWKDFVTPSDGPLKSIFELGVGLVFTYHFPNPSSSTSSVPPVTLPPSPQEPEPQKNYTINLAGHLFKTGSAELDNKDALQNLLNSAALLSQKPNLRVRIEGHTDSVGTLQKNQVLSQARAEYIKSVLVQGGVSADKIITIGHGPDKPISDNSTPQGRAQNRRVEIYIEEN